MLQTDAIHRNVCHVPNPLNAAEDRLLQNIVEIARVRVHAARQATDDVLQVEIDVNHPLIAGKAMCVVQLHRTNESLALDQGPPRRRNVIWRRRSKLQLTDTTKAVHPRRRHGLFRDHNDHRNAPNQSNRTVLHPAAQAAAAAHHRLRMIPIEKRHRNATTA